MDDQQNALTYEIIKAAVAGEKWATERILKYYDDYMTELATTGGCQCIFYDSPYSKNDKGAFGRSMENTKLGCYTGC